VGYRGWIGGVHDEPSACGAGPQGRVGRVGGTPLSLAIPPRGFPLIQKVVGTGVCVRALQKPRACPDGECAAPTNSHPCSDASSCVLLPPLRAQHTPACPSTHMHTPWRGWSLVGSWLSLRQLRRLTPLLLLEPMSQPPVPPRHFPHRPASSWAPPSTPFAPEKPNARPGRRSSTARQRRPSRGGSPAATWRRAPARRPRCGPRSARPSRASSWWARPPGRPASGHSSAT